MLNFSLSLASLLSRSKDKERGQETRHGANYSSEDKSHAGGQIMPCHAFFLRLHIEVNCSKLEGNMGLKCYYFTYSADTEVKISQNKINKVSESYSYYNCFCYMLISLDKKKH